MRRLRRASSDYLSNSFPPSSTEATTAPDLETTTLSVADVSLASDDSSESSIVNEEANLERRLEANMVPDVNQKYHKVMEESICITAPTKQTSPTSCNPPKPRLVSMPKVSVFLAAQASQNGHTNTFAGVMKFVDWKYGSAIHLIR